MSVSTMGMSSAPTPTIVTTESSTKEEASDVMIQREEDVQLCNMNVTIQKKKRKYSASRTRYGDSKKRKQSTEEGTSRACSPTVKDIYKNIVCMGYFSKALSSSSQKMNSCKEAQTQDQTNAHQNHNNNVADSTKKRSEVSHHNQSVKKHDDALSLLHKAYLQALNQTSC